MTRRAREQAHESREGVEAGSDLAEPGNRKERLLAVRETILEDDFLGERRVGRHVASRVGDVRQSKRQTQGHDPGQKTELGERLAGTLPPGGQRQ